jgi:hypothetical protein
VNFPAGNVLVNDQQSAMLQPTTIHISDTANQEVESVEPITS